MDIRHAVGVKEGVDSETLAAVPRWRESECFTVRERVAMALCEAIVRDDLDVSDECFARVREHFSEADTVELVFVIGYQVFASKFAKAMRVPVQGFSRPAEAR
jgi:alkylhydroperoxidase family enzyme